jgi:hypothetical protein
MTATPDHSRVLLAALLLAAALPLAGCQTDSTGRPVARAAPAAPAVTRQQAALDCWMATEHGRADLPLDQRTAIVDACIKDKMAGKPLPGDVSEEAGAKAKGKTKTKAKLKPKSQTQSKT